uniref:Cytochrome P450 n=1 Tax=Heterorhabditis bacteriophora TaxID=37862 RepID=A0A1I7X009_HETBA
MRFGYHLYIIFCGYLVSILLKNDILYRTTLPIIGNYLLPAGSQVNISPIILHYNEEVYPDPHYYNPDRFLPENISKRHAYDYIPFSAGLRNCIGQKFALYEEKVMVSWLLRRFSNYVQNQWKVSNSNVEMKMVTGDQRDVRIAKKHIV